MNVQIRAPSLPITQAAEGMPRRAWMLDEIEAMVAAGIIAEDERFELIGGEVVPMSPKGIWHEEVKRVLNRHWVKALPPDLQLLPETTLRISQTEFREPDFVFWPSSVALKNLAPSHLLLVVEVADSSLNYDLGRKAQFYASIGLRDYWVIDAKRLVTRIHRSPQGERFGDVADLAGDALLTPLLVPELAVQLTALGLEPMAE